jgi:DNA polymerase III subunit delta'
MDYEVMPWHRSSWDNLMGRMTAGQLPHALLLTGPAGIGKNQFADLFTRSVLCRQPQMHGIACGECRTCLLTRAETHPDVHWVTPPEEGKVIGVDQVREITHYLSLKSQYGGYKLAIISPADRLNINASNSLLKTLEEPPADTILILITEQPAGLPATVRSRCQKITITTPPAEIALKWLTSRIGPEQDAATLLELAGGAPLTALKIVAGDWLRQRLDLLEDLEKVTSGQFDPVVIADKWLKFGIKESLYWMYSWLVDMIRIKTAYQPPFVGNRDVHQRLRELADKQGIARLFWRLDCVSDALRLLDSQVNTQLLMEEILLAWIPGQEVPTYNHNTGILKR